MARAKYTVSNVICDQCDDWAPDSTDIGASVRYVNYASYLRSKGWVVGKTDLCPKCANKIRKPFLNLLK